MKAPENAFLDYVRPYWRSLHAVARQHAVRQADAADLVQETLLRAWRSFAPSDERTYGRAWVFTILRNVVLEWQRTAGRRVRLVLVPVTELTEMAAGDIGAPFADLPALTEDQFRELLDERIAAALDGISASFREVLILSAVGGLTYREIAEVLDCPVGTVMSRMARARRALRERIAEFAPSKRPARENRT